MPLTDFAPRRIRRAALLFVEPPASHAQTRMPPLPADRMTEAQKKAAAEFEAARGALSGPWAVILRSPEMINRARSLSDYLRFNSSLPPRLSEFVILITAREWTQQYEWNAHHSLAIKGGLNPEIAKAVAEGRRPDKMADDEAALVRFLHRAAPQSQRERCHLRPGAGEIRRAGRRGCDRPEWLVHAGRDGAEHGAHTAAGRCRARAGAVPSIVVPARRQSQQVRAALQRLFQNLWSRTLEQFRFVRSCPASAGPWEVRLKADTTAETVTTGSTCRDCRSAGLQACRGRADLKVCTTSDDFFTVIMSCGHPKA